MEEKHILNLDNISFELKLIFEIIRTEDIKKLRTILKESVKRLDWNLFLELVMHHRVYPLLAGKLKMIKENIIPPFVYQNISQMYMMNTFKMLQFSGEMEQVSRWFNDNNIPLIFLKGPVLGAELFGDISLRSSGDLDFIIPISDLEKAETILLKKGYVKDDYIQTILNDWKWRHHHVTYFHPEKEIKLEIHWRLHPGPGKEPRFNELWERKRVSSLTSTPIYYLGNEDLFLFLASHGSRHGWSRLRWLVDIHQLVRQTIDWKKLIGLLKNYHCTDIGGQALILSSQIIGTPITNDMERLIRGNHPRKLAQGAIFYLERMINLHNEPVPEDIARYHKQHLYCLMSSKQRFIFIMSFLYPYPEDAKTLPLPKQFHFLYFLLRPFLWAWRKSKFHAIS